MDKVEKTETTIEEAHPYQYDMIAKMSLPSNPVAMEKLCMEISRLIKRVAYLSWLNPHTRTLLHLEWQRRRTLSFLSKKAPVVSKMSGRYNSSKTGHNQQLTKEINSAFITAKRLTDIGQVLPAAKIIKNLGLHPIYFLTNDRLPIMEKHSKRTLKVIDKLNKTRGHLVRYVMRLAAQKAGYKIKSLSGEVIDYPELLQVALLAAYDGTLIWDTSKAHTWTKFTERRMEKSIAKFVTDNSRTVPIPRTKIDIFSPVKEAIDIVGMSDYGAIANTANTINSERKMSHSGRKLRPNEIYTAKKVEELLRYITENLSLDNLATEIVDEAKEEVSLIETLSEETHTAEDEADLTMMARSLRRMLRKYLRRGTYSIPALRDYAYELMILRWGMDEKFPETLDYAEVMEIFRYRHPNTKIHRSQIKKLEVEVMTQLKTQMPKDLKELWEAYSCARMRGA